MPDAGSSASSSEGDSSDAMLATLPVWSQRWAALRTQTRALSIPSTLEAAGRESQHAEPLSKTGSTNSSPSESSSESLSERVGVTLKAWSQTWSQNRIKPAAPPSLSSSPAPSSPDIRPISRDGSSYQPPSDPDLPLPEAAASDVNTASNVDEEPVSREQRARESWLAFWVCAFWS